VSVRMATSKDSRPETSVPVSEPRPQYPSLDGLRGAAAFVVLLCHTLIVQPALMQAYLDPDVIPKGSPAWWATFSPLHLPWAGMEMVYLFFVLSGFVLTLPFVGKRPRRWAGYLPKRLLRLYPPAWGAFGLAVLWMILFPRHFSTKDSVWLQVHPPELTEAAMRGDLLLVPGPMGSNSVLWTLKFEVIFSLLLPLLVWLGSRLPKLNLLKGLLLFGAVIAFASSGLTVRFFLPMFALGILLALERDRLASVGHRIRTFKHGRAAWWGLTIVCLALLNSYWTVRGITSDPDQLAYLVPVTHALGLAGACMAVFLAIEGTWCRWLETPMLRWLGKRAFSLYLVHEPVIVSVAVLLGGNPGPVLSVAVVVPSALAVAAIFYFVVEHPSHQLSRVIGATINRWRDRQGDWLPKPATVPDSMRLPIKRRIFGESPP
jgi:peptidoglycan/LPS O-acetylase OafA/YrhL